jgi:hypothetical protein
MNGYGAADPCSEVCLARRWNVLAQILGGFLFRKDDGRLRRRFRRDS